MVANRFVAGVAGRRVVSKPGRPADLPSGGTFVDLTGS